MENKKKKNLFLLQALVLFGLISNQKKRNERANEREREERRFFLFRMTTRYCNHVCRMCLLEYSVRHLFQKDDR